MEPTPFISRELHAPSSLSVLGTMVDSPRWTARTLNNLPTICHLAVWDDAVD